MSTQILPDKPQLISARTTIGLIGLLGLMFPTVLILTAIIKDGCTVLDSLSAYYYTGSRDAFIGILSAMAFAFFSYHGYSNNRGVITDSMAGNLAAISALGVAYFPTAVNEPTGCISNPQYSNYEAVHYGSAVLLFMMLAYFCIFQFTRSKGGISYWDKEERKLFTEKKSDECTVYIICGAVILLCLLIGGLHAFGYFHYKKTVMVIEVVMITAFSVAWLYKSNFGGFRE